MSTVILPNGACYIRKSRCCDIFVATKMVSQNKGKSELNFCDVEKVLGHKPGTYTRKIWAYLVYLKEIGFISKLEKRSKGFFVEFPKLTREFTKIDPLEYFSVEKGKARLMFFFLESVRRFQGFKIGIFTFAKKFGINSSCKNIVRRSLQKHLKKLEKIDYVFSRNCDDKLYFDYGQIQKHNLFSMPDLERVRWNNFHENMPRKNETERRVNFAKKDGPKEELVVDQNNTPVFGARDGVRRFTNPSNNQDNFVPEQNSATSILAADTPTTKTPTQKHETCKFFNDVESDETRFFPKIDQSQVCDIRYIEKFLIDEFSDLDLISAIEIARRYFDGSPEKLKEYFDEHFVKIAQSWKDEGKTPEESWVLGSFKNKHKYKKSKEQKKKEKLAKEQERREKEYRFQQSGFALERSEDETRKQIIQGVKDRNLKLHDIMPDVDLSKQNIQWLSMSLVSKTKEILGIDEPDVFLTVTQNNEFLKLIGVK